MCDNRTELENQKYLQEKGSINRRDFGKVSALASLMAMVPPVANAMDVTETNVTITTPDGEAEAFFVHPSTGKHPAILMWTDILGLRNAFRVMSKRLAEAGYSVLVPNPFYRDAKIPVVPEGSSFQDDDTRTLLRGYAGKLTQDAAFSDAKAYIGFLDEQESVDTDRKVGTNGYCMGGPLIMRTAAAVPDRVGAAASFHAGRLVTDGDDSPHLLIPKTPAHVLHAIAANDHERAPETKDILIAAYEDAGIPAEIEVYEGSMHGWCSLDSPVYNEEQAERAWARMLHLFETTLT
ncbi:MAG: dienelactone hydrolase family protein [Acidiferrobacterales bacterium]|nr:dienelactone hydrolase family protein [Acidiferrobacterales bacterium]